MTTEFEFKESTLIDKKYRKIPFCSWVPDSPQSQIVIVHGFSEHYRYYHKFSEQCAQKGIIVHAMDLPGHGKAEGVRGHIDDFQEYIDNVDFLFKSNPDFKNIPSYLLGHSLGGLIASYYCLQYKPEINGMILISPLFGFPISNLPIIFLAKLLSKKYSEDLFPKPFMISSLSRNKNSHLLYRNDPLRLHCISPKLLLSMYEYCRQVRYEGIGIQIPILTFITQKDKIISIPAVNDFMNKCKAKDKTLIIFTNAMHEIIQEEECTQVIDKVNSWISDHN